MTMTLTGLMPVPSASPLLGLHGLLEVGNTEQQRGFTSCSAEGNGKLGVTTPAGASRAT